MIIPLTIDYVNKSVYGIWLTMYSIVSWLSLFDVGLGNGLRNKLSAALANGEREAATEYVSTTYFAMLCISLSLLILSLILSYALDWVSILKLPSDYHYNISQTLAILSFFFCIRFVVQLISTVYFAIQKAFMVELINMLGNLIVLGAVYFGRQFFQNDKLLFLVFALCVPPILVMIVFSFRLFLSKSFGYLRPRISCMRKDKMTSLVNLGLGFFLLQICGLLTYSMTNFLILRFLNADDVTYYNLSYKYFSALLILNNIVCAPLWSAFTEAYALRDLRWIKNCVRKMSIFFCGICLLGIVMLLLSPYFYKFWLNGNIGIPFSLSTATMLFILVACYNGIVIAFINGVGKIRLQTYLTIINTILYIPLCYLLTEYFHFGVTGFVAYMFVSNLIISVISAIQTDKIINDRAYGIWNK